MGTTPKYGIVFDDGSTAFDPPLSSQAQAVSVDAALDTVAAAISALPIFMHGVKSVTTNATGDYTLNFGDVFPTSCDRVFILDGMAQTTAGFGTMIHRIGTRSPGQVTARALNSKDGSAVNAVTINVLWLAIGH